MKKIVSLIVTFVLIICMGAVAYAFNWQDTEAAECTEYTLTATKYIQVDSDVGVAYQAAPGATAKVGDTVYFSLSAVDTKGEKVEAEVEYHNLGNVETLSNGKLYKAKVVGNEPWVRISITEKTPMNELIYGGEPIHVTNDTVVIGKLMFTRNDKGIVTDVYHEENTAEMLKDIAALGLNVNDIYDGKICMTDDILISNFGKVCKTSSTAAWYVPTSENNIELGIPKTGDKPLLAWIAWLFGK